VYTFAAGFAHLRPFTLTLLVALFTVEALHDGRGGGAGSSGEGTVTKKEIVKQISERIGLTQLKTKEIVQQTFDAIVETLLEVGRIELRNFGVFEVKQRKARKARNPRTGDRVDVPPKNVVTFKPGKEMEEKVRQMTHIPEFTETEDEGDLVAGASNGLGDGASKVRPVRPRKGP
jgi:nucleoid DNA-binding protein